MGDKSMGALPHIPDAALEVLVARGYNVFPDAGDEAVRRDLQLIAAPILAAEFRRFADELVKPYDETGADWPLVSRIAVRMLDRATALDGKVVCPTCTVLIPPTRGVCSDCEANDATAGA